MSPVYTHVITLLRFINYHNLFLSEFSQDVEEGRREEE